jgi:hypothetical protein
MRQRKNKTDRFSPSKRRKDPIKAAADYGIDIQMLADNLARTPAERIRRHQIALDLFNALRKAKNV